MHRTVSRRPRAHHGLRLVVAGLLTLALAVPVASDPAPASADPGGAAVRNGKVGPSDTGTRGTVEVRELPRRAERGSVTRPVLDLHGPFEGRSDARSEPADTTVGPVLASTTTAPPASKPGWAGMTYADTGYQPADPWVAAGPEHIVQVVNTSIRIWDRTGVTTLPATELAAEDLFALPSGYENSDPRVIYDALHGRWVLSELSWTCDDGSGRAVGFVDFLISRTADPMGAWDSRWIQWDGYLPDYPAFGTSTDKLAVASNVFELGSGPACTAGAPYVGADVTIMDWAELLSAPTSGGFTIENLSWADGGDHTAYFTPRVALQTPATSPTLQIVVQHAIGDGLVMHYSKVTGSVVGGTVDVAYEADLDQIGVSGASVEPPDPIQPGGTAVTDRIDSRPTDAIYQGGRVAWVASNGCAPAGGGGQRACVRVTEILANTASSAPSASQDFLVAESGADHFFGGIGYALDGTLHVVWTRSADATGGQPSSLTAYQRTRDPDDSLSAAQVIVQGTGGAFTGGRWGDYVGVAQDPQVPNAVWQGNAYSTGGLAWATRVTQLQTGGATYVPVAPIRVLDSRTPLGVTGSFKANQPRTFAVAPFTSSGDDIPANAIAVTGNVTVTGQTGSGYVSITSTATTTPRSSTINFPTGETRANNVTIPLASDGRLAAVYKASSGRTAHVIFDVTGYFLAGTGQAAYETLAPTRFLDSRVDKGVSGPFRSGIPRKLDVAGVSGVPADAVAVTANLTVVGQTRGGFVSVTPTSQAQPGTSTINFPTGDTRANGLTAKLSGGDVWLVYKSSSSSATTELILDITGYYRPAGNGMAFFPLDPGRIMDTRTSVLSGLTGRFTSGVQRHLDVDGHWGVPVGARAITGNLTVTGQSGKGYVSATTTDTSTPSTSTINFPTGESRANGITVPLTAKGNEWFVYKSGSGRTTHLILDVTGYFR